MINNDQEINVDKMSSTVSAWAMVNTQMSMPFHIILHPTPTHIHLLLFKTPRDTDSSLSLSSGSCMNLNRTFPSLDFYFPICKQEVESLLRDENCLSGFSRVESIRFWGTGAQTP